MSRILPHRLGHVDPSTTSVDGLWLEQLNVVRRYVAGEIGILVP